MAAVANAPHGSSTTHRSRYGGRPSGQHLSKRSTGPRAQAAMGTRRHWRRCSARAPHSRPGKARSTCTATMLSAECRASAMQCRPRAARHAMPPIASAELSCLRSKCISCIYPGIYGRVIKRPAYVLLIRDRVDRRRWSTGGSKRGGLGGTCQHRERTAAQQVERLSQCGWRGPAVHEMFVGG